MRTLIEVLKLSTEFLAQKGISQPRRQAEELLCDAFGLQRMQLYMEHDRPLNNVEIDLMRARLVRRGKGEPVPYIHGSVKFYGCVIKVNPDVLIPRQETEILVDKVVKELEGKALAGKILWDLCCGSGCLGIAIKKKFPDLQVFLSDISEKALAIAADNACSNGVDVECLLGDLLTPFAQRKADYVICNPPYITEADYAHLDNEVKNFEPRLALVSGPTGLEIYERLAQELGTYLNPGGRAWFEIGTGQGEQLKNAFQKGPWKEIRTEKDWAAHDRFFSLEIV